MKIRSAKNKGYRLEKWVERFFQPWFPAERKGGTGQVDVDGTPWWIECKNREKGSIRQAIGQAVAARDKKNDKRPIIVIHKKNRVDPVVSMRMIDFVRITGLEERPDEA